MIRVIYKHPLHGEKHYLCKEIIKMGDVLKVNNEQGETFIVIDPKRIISIEGE